MAADRAMREAGTRQAPAFNESLYLYHKGKLYTSQARFKSGFSEYQIAEVYGNNGKELGEKAQTEAERQKARKKERDERKIKLQQLRMQLQQQGKLPPGAAPAPAAPAPTPRTAPAPPPAGWR
jgi:hypothetical protein